MQEDKYPPRILADDEIELYLNGDRREVDRLMLYSLNRLAAALLPHITNENDFKAQLEQLGGIKGIIARAAYVDSLIKKNTAKAMMMEKVSQGTVLWVVLAFLGFVAMSVWDSLIHAIKLKLGAYNEI